MAHEYRELRDQIVKGMLERRPESWFHERIENAQGTQTQYVNMGRDLSRFLEWLNYMVAQEDNLDNAQFGSALFIIGGV